MVEDIKDGQLDTEDRPRSDLPPIIRIPEIGFRGDGADIAG